MALDTIFDHASSVMTVISFITFVGIMWWTFAGHRASDFAAAAQLPFADDEENTHV
ncbi:MAG TPA: CcoQ/FixQ family Cbb3-type cytochrome c oxidase assembly chaperone [Burkholderiaceae bacterium]|nr:CcoQ/FixQ family Cbb3-type cytochrome c oxidase assembly chaperone [Burkholderiaceae bacterium]